MEIEEIQYDQDSNSSNSHYSDLGSDLEDDDSLIVEENESDSSNDNDGPNEYDIDNPSAWKNISEIEFSDMNSNCLSMFSEPIGFIYSLEPKHNSIFDYFRLFLNDEIINDLVNQSNLFLKQFLDNHEDIDKFNIFKNVNFTKDDILLFIGIIIYMGIVKLPKQRFHWKKDTLFNNSIVSSLISRRKFEIIKRFFHVNDNSLVNPNDKLYKIRPFLSKSCYLYKKYYSPHRILCVDEKMVPWRGRTKWKQYAPDKPTKFGFKIFTLCDAETNYIYSIDIYTGKKETVTKNLGARTVTELISGLENKGHVIYMDSFYSSVDLFRDLEIKMFGCTGTVKKNRKGLPPEMKGKKVLHGERIYYQSGKLVAMKWKDKRDIFLMTNHDYGSSQEFTTRANKVVKKPYPITRYNIYKGGVDVANQYTAYYANEHIVGGFGYLVEY